MADSPRPTRRVVAATVRRHVVAALACFAPAAAAADGSGPPPSEVGSWGPVLLFPAIPIHAHLLPTGKVLFWDRHDLESGPIAHPHYWDPADGSFALAPAPPTGHDLFCSGHAFLADGRLFVAGGHIADHHGQPFVAIFDPTRERWAVSPPMNAGRWYPSVATLASGEALVLGGADERAEMNPLPQIYRPESDDWRDLYGAERTLPYYPFLFQDPLGQALVAGPEGISTRLDPSGTGSWAPLGPTHHPFRSYGSAVAYASGRFLVAGGGSPPTASTATLDLSQAAPVWIEAEPMAFARRQLNLTLLPDGQVLATGGTSAEGFNNSTGAVLAAELWNPVTRAWTSLAEMSVPRLYHSIALLLPDGRVLVAGGGHPSDVEHGDPDHLDAQLFSPPYLFRGERPTIAATPATVRLGEAFPIASTGPPAIRATWLRLGSVTHAFDMNQRFVELPYVGAPGGGVAVAPSDPALAPPGHYLMFLLDALGVPSEARLIRLAPGIFGDGFEIGSPSVWSDTN